MTLGPTFSTTVPRVGGAIAEVEPLIAVVARAGPTWSSSGTTSDVGPVRVGGVGDESERPRGPMVEGMALG